LKATLTDRIQTLLKQLLKRETTGSRRDCDEDVHFKLERAVQPIRNYFDFVMTGYEVICDKSNPKMYLRVLEILEVRPSETVVIGDDIQLDALFPNVWA
jgi:beta-phosphoglucomutase-like phosphatase (HAD superfamily)